ncbi:MAG: DUF3881 family protein [Lachnospiraceae bacterium]
MHSFLKAVGFSDLEGRTDEEKLMNLVIENATERQVAKITDKRSAVELYMEVAENVGLVLCGEYDERGNFHAEYYFPVLKGQNVSMTEAVYINKRVDTNAFTGMCDDYRIGVSLIFYIQNKMDLLGRNVSRRDRTRYPITLTALAGEGKILLPVQKTRVEVEKVKADLQTRSSLIAEAKKGNQEAMESLTMDDIDQYALVSRRIRKEDIYSIVETTFIPYGSESDNYTVLGYITDVRECVNTYTKERLYILSLLCNELPFEVCINQNSLVGEPVPGRRFRGNVWMQGKIEVM